VATDILIRFLGAGLINVGGDDAKLERLKSTSASLATALKNAPSKAASFALIAFDPEAPADDPVIKEAVEALQKHWATYVNTFSGTPVTVIRAMLLDALAQAAAADDKVGVAFVNSARNVLPYMEADNEGGVWTEVVTEIEQRVDARAESEWATPDSISAPPLTYVAPAAVKVVASPANINSGVVTKKIEAAVGPQNAAGQATSGNPNWPNQGAPWAMQFAAKLSEVLIENFVALSKGAAIAPIDLSGPLEGLAQVVSTYVEETLKAVSCATAGLQRRVNLIWWKETLYSPSARFSYRDMPTSTAAALMAFDLHQQVPTFSPASVAAFLHEAVLGLPSLHPGKARPIRDLLNEAIDCDELAPLREAAARLFSEPVGRGPLLGILGHGAGRQPLCDGKFRAQVGIPAATPLTVPEWATWLFRELQAARAAQQRSEAKKRGRKPS
jgi:hypothetical protein